MPVRLRDVEIARLVAERKVLPDDYRRRLQVRYNGESHEHTNVIEGEAFYDFHIHVATERYQDLGMREDSFAEVTERFGDYDGAVRALLADCGFQAPASEQRVLFGEEIWR